MHSIQNTLFGTIDTYDIIQPSRNWSSSSEDQTDTRIPQSSSIRCHSPHKQHPWWGHRPPSSTFINNTPLGPRGLPTGKEFCSVWVSFPFLKSLHFPLPQSFQLWNDPTATIDVYICVTWWLGLFNPPLCLLLSSPKANGSGSRPLHSILFKSCTTDIENSHSAPLFLPPTEQGLPAVLATAVPPAEGPLFSNQRRVVVLTGLDAQAPQPGKGRISSLNQTRRHMDEMRRNIDWFSLHAIGKWV